MPPFLERAPKLLEAMGEVTGGDIPDDLTGPARGAWLRERKIEAAARAMGCSPKGRNERYEDE
jgi:hypothetical protein